MADGVSSVTSEGDVLSCGVVAGDYVTSALFQSVTIYGIDTYMYIYIYIHIYIYIIWQNYDIVKVIVFDKLMCDKVVFDQ